MIEKTEKKIQFWNNLSLVHGEGKKGSFRMMGTGSKKICIVIPTLKE